VVIETAFRIHNERTTKDICCLTETRSKTCKAVLEMVSRLYTDNSNGVSFTTDDWSRIGG
jgi:hypothetical protein